MNWSRKEEQRHAELTAELSRLERARSAAWTEVHNAFMACWVENEFSTDAAISKADRLRDALAPFDSGIRSGKSE